MNGDRDKESDHSPSNSAKTKERESIRNMKRPKIKMSPFVSAAGLPRDKRKRKLKKIQSQSVDHINTEQSVSEKPKIIAKRKASIEIIMFPKNSVSQYVNTSSLDVSILSIAGLPKNGDAIVEDDSQSPVVKSQGQVRFPTLLTAASGGIKEEGDSPKNRLSLRRGPTLQRLDTQEQPAVPLGPFLPLSAIKMSKEYVDLKQRLADNDRLSSIRKQLRYNKKSTEKYRKAVRKSNDSLLECIVDIAKHDSRHENIANKVVTRKKTIEIDDDPNTDDLVSQCTAKDLSLAWHPRKDMLGGPIEFREGRRMCSVNHLAYMMGGYSTGGNKFDTLMCYDISTNALKVCPTGRTTPGQRAYHSMVHLNGGIYIFGGELIRRSVDTLYYDDVWRYDLRSFKYRLIRTPSRITGRKYHAAIAFGNNYMLVSGGLSDQRTCLGDLYVLATGRKVLTKVSKHLTGLKWDSRLICLESADILLRLST